MGVYAIGDVQGCFDELQGLLDKLDFDKSADQLWFVGDLVNRGPKSLETLRFVKDLGDTAMTVLGNHDLHLLAVDAGAQRKKSDSSLQAILDAPDKHELLTWLRNQPLMHYDEQLSTAMIHAGLLPQWSLAQAQALAAEVEERLRGKDHEDFLGNMYGDNPDCWSASLGGWERLRIITNSLTRLRYCDAHGRIDMAPKGPPGTQDAGLIPWFEAPDRKSKDTRIICGHWSALGFHDSDNVLAIDCGCVWGGQLAAVQLDVTAPRLITIDCADATRPT
ncbi:MAG: symmetrical bis(5'-nucleosyl)-tetraphosphatase [Gammaproteobacteria bacterium]